MPDTKKKPNIVLKLLRWFLSAVLAILSVVLSLGILGGVALSSGGSSGSSQSGTADVAIMDKYDMHMTNQISSALEGVLSIKKVYWLSDSDLVAPKPDPARYGEADSPGELAWLLEEAEDLIGGQEMVFSVDRNVWNGAKIHYYYDETILAIVWKQVIDGSLYTVAEVKIADPSQFRRFLAGGEFGSDKQYTTTEMASSVNAVLATSGDFYKYRRNGIVVYNGELQRFEPRYVDTCYIDDNGDLLFSYRNQIKTEEEAEQFIEENNVRFSLAFGPVLIDNGEVCAPSVYTLGEVEGWYSRAAVCQVDDLHYMVINISQDGGYNKRQKIVDFARHIHDNFPCEKAYALDGGQTTVIALNGELMARPDYGTQRQISDIIYFATAIPNRE